MEIMLDGQLITCTPEEYMKLKSLGAFGGTAAGSSTEKPLQQHEYDSLEKRIRDLEKERDSYPNWLKRGQMDVVAVYGCQMPSPLTCDSTPSFNPETFKPSVTVTSNGTVSFESQDTKSNIQVDVIGDHEHVYDKRLLPDDGKHIEQTPPSAFLMAAVDDIGRPIYISSLQPSLYSYKISHALKFKTPEDAREQTEFMTSNYDWRSIPMPCPEECERLDREADADEAKQKEINDDTGI